MTTDRWDIRPQDQQNDTCPWVFKGNDYTWGCTLIPSADDRVPHCCEHNCPIRGKANTVQVIKQLFFRDRLITEIRGNTHETIHSIDARTTVRWNRITDNRGEEITAYSYLTGLSVGDGYVTVYYGLNEAITELENPGFSFK